MRRDKLKIDLLDRKILYYLDINARQPTTTLAKKVRASPATVEYRIKRMERGGLIKNYMTFLDAGKIGYMVWNVYLELHNVTEKEESELFTYLCNLENSWWVARCAGKWDAVYSIGVKNIKEFYRTVTDVWNRFSKYIIRQSIEAHVELAVISRGYFLNKPGISVPWYTTFQQEILTEIERKILKTISENARMPTTEIARKTTLTPKIVSYHLKDLERRGIISRYRLQLDVSKIGFKFFKAIVYLKVFTYEMNMQLKEYCIQEGNIFHYEQKIGHWMLELELDARDFERADSQMKKLKERFPDFIRNYELLLITEELKGDLDFSKVL